MTTKLIWKGHHLMRFRNSTFSVIQRDIEAGDVLVTAIPGGVRLIQLGEYLDVLVNTDDPDTADLARAITNRIDSSTD